MGTTQRERLDDTVDELRDMLAARYDELIAGGAREDRWQLINLVLDVLTETPTRTAPAPDPPASRARRAAGP